MGTVGADIKNTVHVPVHGTCPGFLSLSLPSAPLSVLSRPVGMDAQCSPCFAPRRLPHSPPPPPNHPLTRRSLGN